MSGFGETVGLERSLLHVLTTSKMMARTYMYRVKAEWFTSKERRFIASTAIRIYRDTKSQVTRRIFDYELSMKVDEDDHTFYEGEWNLVQGIAVHETAEALIDRLTEAHVGRRMLDVLEDAAIKLTAGDVQEALAYIKSSTMQITLKGEEKPTREITDYKHRHDLIRDKQQHPEKYLGLKTGVFPSFDRRTGGLFAGELTLIAGLTGLGKSTFVKALQWGIVTENPTKNVLHIANEEYDIQVENKFDALITEIPYLDFKFANISDKDLEDWAAKMEEMKEKVGSEFGRIFTKEVPAFTDVTLVEQAYRELENQGIKIDAIIIDHLPHIIPIQRAYDKNDEQAKAAGDCKELARSLALPVVIPTQAATGVEDKTKKGKRAGDLDVYGSKGQIHVANNFGIITYRGKADDQPHLEDEDKDVLWLVDFKKTRDGARFSFPARHYVQYGKVLEIAASGAQDDDEVQKELENAVGDGEEDEDSEGAEPESSPEPESEHEPEIEPESWLDERQARLAEKKRKRESGEPENS
jgi:replicative DNA helicase